MAARNAPVAQGKAHRFGGPHARARRDAARTIAHERGDEKKEPGVRPSDDLPARALELAQVEVHDADKRRVVVFVPLDRAPPSRRAGAAALRLLRRGRHLAGHKWVLYEVVNKNQYGGFNDSH